MSRRFSWDYLGIPASPFEVIPTQQYLRGKAFVPGVDLTPLVGALDFPPDGVTPGTGVLVPDGFEYDTIPEWDVRNCSVAAWVKLDRLPATTDPFGVFNRERFGLVTRSALQGSDYPGIAFELTGRPDGTELSFQITRASQCGALSAAGDLPIEVGKWFLVGGSHVLDVDGGPRLYYGDLNTPMREPTAYAVRTSGSGALGIGSGGFNTLGQYVARWYYGPLLLGTMTLPTPFNGGGQNPPGTGGTWYGNLTPPWTSSFGSLQGFLAHVTIWGGPLTLTQWKILQNSGVAPSTRPFLPRTHGFPPLLADWWLDEVDAPGIQTTFTDRSGAGHHLVAIGPVVHGQRVSPSPSQFRLWNGVWQA